MQIAQIDENSGLLNHGRDCMSPYKGQNSHHPLRTGSLLNFISLGG